jgi:hypothetical protein
VLEHRLLVLRVVVLCVLGDVPELARGADALRDLAPPVGAQGVELELESVVALRSEDYVLQEKDLQSPETRTRRLSAPRGRAW